MNNKNTLQNFPTNGSNFSDYLQRHDLDAGQFAKVCGLSQRTIRRWMACNKPPRYAWLLAYSLAGFILCDGWQGWQFQAGSLWHRDAPATRHSGLTPGTLYDLAYSLQYSRSVARSMMDLTRENARLKSFLQHASLKARTPKNLIFFPGVTPDTIPQLKKEF